MTKDEVIKLIASKHNLEASKKHGMVYQVWEDGEITLQKSGDLLWRRTLHCIAYGFTDHNLQPNEMPVSEKKRGYAFVDSKEDADECRKAIESLEPENN